MKSSFGNLGFVGRLIAVMLALAVSPVLVVAQESDLTDEQLEEIQNQVALGLHEILEQNAFNRVRFSSDVRVRYHGEYFGDENDIYIDPAKPTGDPLNNDIDRHRFRTRARVGMVSDLGMGFETGFRLVSGGSSPTSLNQTMGTFFQKYAVGLDTAYGKWMPFYPFVNLMVGRFANPFWSTEMVWNSSLNFDGAALQANLPARFDGFISDQFSFQIEPGIAGGAFPLEELNFEEADKYLLGGQVNVKLGLSRLVYPKPEFKFPQLRLGVGYYSYVNTQGEFSPLAEPTLNDFTVPLIQQKGNTRFDINPDTATTKLALASKFTIVDVLGEISFKMIEPIPFSASITGNYVTNIGYVENEINERTGIEVDPATTAYYARLDLGYGLVKGLGMFSLFGTYRYLERDAVMDAYTDSDFHGGGTDAQGFTVGGTAYLSSKVTVSVSYMDAQEIDPDPTASSGGGWNQKSVLIDFNFSY